MLSISMKNINASNWVTMVIKPLWPHWYTLEVEKYRNIDEKHLSYALCFSHNIVHFLELF